MATKGYKYRLYPTAAQAAVLESQMETLRHLHNTALAVWKDRYAAVKAAEAAGEPCPFRVKTMGRGEIKALLRLLRRLQQADRAAGGEGPHWLTALSSEAVSGATERLRKAFANFFGRVAKKISPAGYPRFKRHGDRPSVEADCGSSLRLASTPAGGDRFARLTAFGVPGEIRVRYHRPLPGETGRVVLSRDAAGRWWVVFTVRKTPAVPTMPTAHAVGIDLGLDHFLYTSDGESVPNPRFLAASLGRRKRLDRSLSRKREAAKADGRRLSESKNYQRAKADRARADARVADLRRDFHHQTAVRLVRRYRVIVVENLNVRGLSRGRLARSVLDAGWAAFLSILEAKCRDAGATFVKVNPAGTSQTCPECQKEVRKGLSVRTHRCPHCGYTAPRDHAAARVILARGLAQLKAGAGQTLKAGEEKTSSRRATKTPVRPAEKSAGTASPTDALSSRTRVAAASGSPPAPRKRSPKRPPLATPSLFDGVDAA